MHVTYLKQFVDTSSTQTNVHVKIYIQSHFYLLESHLEHYFHSLLMAFYYSITDDFSAQLKGKVVTITEEYFCLETSLKT